MMFNVNLLNVDFYDDERDLHLSGQLKFPDDSWQHLTLAWLIRNLGQEGWRLKERYYLNEEKTDLYFEFEKFGTSSFTKWVSPCEYEDAEDEIRRLG